MGSGEHEHTDRDDGVNDEPFDAKTVGVAAAIATFVSTLDIQPVCTSINVRIAWSM